MITVKHVSSRTSINFHDNIFEVTGVPMTNHNPIVISEALNDKSSKYGDEAFTPKPDGSCYNIAVRALTSQTVFKDTSALQVYILEKLKACSLMLEERKS